MSDCLAVLIVWLSDCLSVWQFGSLTVWLSDCLTVWLSDCPIVWLSDCLTAWLSDCLIFWMPDRLAIWLFDFLFLSNCQRLTFWLSNTVLWKLVGRQWESFYMNNYASNLATTTSEQQQETQFPRPRSADKSPVGSLSCLRLGHQGNWVSALLVSLY